MRQISSVGLQLIKDFEGLKLKPYLDVASVPTVGYGTIQYEDGTPVTLSDPPITTERAEELLLFEVNKKCSSIEKMIKVSVSQCQFDACVAFAYNVGVNAFKNSTLLKLLNQSKYNEAADQFLRWNKAGGKEVAGLTRRREAERKLFLS